MAEVRLIDANAAADKIMHEVEVHADEIGIGAVAIMIAFARALRDETDFPTIEQEVRHGKWIFRDDDKSLIEEGILPADMWCSNCGKHHDNDDYGDDYCSTCGVKMDLPDEYEEKTWGADNDA